MRNGNDLGQDRVRAVLAMRVLDAADLLKFNELVADFSREELIRLADELPRHGSKSAERVLVGRA